MSWRKLNRVLHRDIGYFFFGMAIVYGISGIALNHIDDWDPNYIIRNESLQADPSILKTGASREEVKGILKKLDIHESMKQHYYPNPETLKIFVKGGSVTLNVQTGKGSYEGVSRRPVFYEFNFLHYNNPKFLWTWFADLFGGALVVMALTGILMLQGKRGLTGQGKWYIIAGILIPAIFLLLYL